MFIYSCLIIKYPDGTEQIRLDNKDWKPEVDDIFSDLKGEWYVDKVIDNGHDNYEIEVSILNDQTI